jgi:hypothetical protein
MKGRMFDQYGGMNNSAPGAEDAELVFRYLNKGVAINNLKEVLQYIRIHPLQRSRKYYGKNPAQ